MSAATIGSTHPEKEAVVQLCPLDPLFEARLDALYAVHRVFEPDRAAALSAGTGRAPRAVVTGGHVGLPPSIGAALPALGLVAIYGVGFDKVDLDEARRRGVRVTNTPGVLTDDVADLAVGLTIALLRQLPAADAFVRQGLWETQGFGLARKVSGRRFGILGFGRVGAAIAARLEGFSGQIRYTARRDLGNRYGFVPDARELARWANVLIVAASAAPDTRGLVDAAMLEALGPEGVLINVARGSIVDEVALADALRRGVVAGAALDVFADEPRVPAALVGSPRTVLSPHIASATLETRRAMGDLVLANLAAYFEGREPVTPVV